MIDIFIDMDDCLNDFVKGYFDVYNELYGTNYNFSKNQYIYGDISQYVLNDVDKETAEWRKEEIFETRGFWQHIPIKNNAKDNFETLCEHFPNHVYILTAPWPTSVICIPEKIKWIKYNFPKFSLKNIIFSWNKGIFHSNSILIDDNINNLQIWNGKTVKIEYPYNKDYKADASFYNWNEILPIVLKLNGEME